VIRCAKAMAGSESLENLKTLRFEARNSGQKQSLKWEIIRPNLLRKERERAFVLLFDGRRAGYLEGPNLENGTLQGPHLVPQDDWHHFELDIAIYIPAFFEFPSDYAGIATVSGSRAHLLRVTLPMGGVVTYAIHAKSFLPIRVDIPAWNYQRMMGDFKRVGGFFLPHKYWDPSDSSQVTVLKNLTVNADLGKDRFAFPSDIH